jgi:hypothetical protein
MRSIQPDHEISSSRRKLCKKKILLARELILLFVYLLRKGEPRWRDFAGAGLEEI